MNITLRTAAFLLFACPLGFIACKEDEPTPTELLTAGACWKTVLLEGYDTANNTWVAVPVEDCDADNCFTFEADQTFVAEEGATKCHPDDPQTSEGAWSLSGDGKKLSISDAGDSETGTIVELTAGKLVYELTYDDEKIRVTMQTN